ncbi:MAG: hypothetical protein WCG51_03575 [Elusimicrobiota bacterium]
MQKKTVLFCIAAVLSGIVILSAHAGEPALQNPRMQEAMELVKTKNYAAAIDMVTRSIAAGQVADTAETHVFLGALYFKIKQFDNALPEFTQAIASDTNNRMAFWFLGHIYESKALAIADPGQKAAIQRQALESWQHFLVCPRTTATLPVSQKHISISVEESNENAKKHIKILEGELHHE